MKGWCYTQRLLQTELRNGTKSSQSGWGWVKATWFTHLLKQGHPGPRPDGFWVSPRTETPHLPWTNCASAQAPSIKTGFLMFRGASVFSFAPISSDPVTGHHWTFLNDLALDYQDRKPCRCFLPLDCNVTDSFISSHSYPLLQLNEVYCSCVWLHVGGRDVVCTLNYSVLRINEKFFYISF